MPSDAGTRLDAGGIQARTGPGGNDDCFHVLHATYDDVRQVLRSVVAQFSGLSGMDDTGALELALAEVLNNIVEHAYGGAAEGTIILQLKRRQGCIDCVVTDKGREMPSLALPDLPIPADQSPQVADLPEGGYGRYLIRRLASDLHYERRGQMNILSFHLPTPAM